MLNQRGGRVNNLAIALVYFDGGLKILIFNNNNLNEKQKKWKTY